MVFWSKSAAAVVLLFCAISFGHSANPGTHLPDFNVQGTVRLVDDEVVSGAKVIFEGENITKAVITDKRGHYETNLSAGYYTMTVVPSINGIKTYWRPLFHIAPSTRLTLDASLDVGIPCDLVTVDGHKITNDEATDACGGWFYFPVPSKDGVPYQLLIHFPRRQRTDRVSIYRSLSIGGQKTPVRVVYNLFTLRADKVYYDEKNRTLEADGDVVAVNEKGEIASSNMVQPAESFNFRIENGEATRLP